VITGINSLDETPTMITEFNIQQSGGNYYDIRLGVYNPSPFTVVASYVITFMVLT
jgi:hypothetical protein